MPTIKFRGFASASLVALSAAQGAQTASASSTWGTAQATPNASFTIQLVDGCADVAAPYGAVFRATGFTGFNVSEPAGDTNVYDPTQHRITCIWDFDDPGYAPSLAPNIPTVWRNLNLGYGKQVAHVWHTPGSYTVSCFAFDAAGNWGTATYTFQANGQLPAIMSADAAYPGANTIVWSQAGNFSGAPAGATQCSTIAQVHSALRAQATAGVNNRAYRVLLRAGETFTDTFFFALSSGGTGFPGGTSYNYREVIKGMLFGSFGAGARPIIDIRRNAFGVPVQLPDRADCRQFIFSDLDIRCEWDAATETGFNTVFTSILSGEGLILFTRCRWSGMNDIGLDKDRTDHFTIVHDSEVTNWANYGAYMDIPKHAFLGCDLAQKPNALGGINQGTGSQNPWNFGNRHGPYRSGSRPYDTIFSCTSFFTRNGWSTNNGNLSAVAPTAEQPCIRFHGHFDNAGVNLRRHHHVFERCSFEGGWAPVASIGSAGGAPQANIEINAKNLLIDKCLFLAGGGTTGPLLICTMSGVTVRNSYFYRHGINSPAPGGADAEVQFSRVSDGTLAGVGPVEVYNNTVINQRSTGFNSGYAPIRVDAGYSQTVENNVVRIVNRAGFEGAAFLPLETLPLAGFTSRYAGMRWNFPPVSSTPNVSNNTWTAVSRREQPGAPGVLQPGDVANLEWVFLPYPDWTGLCSGAGFPVTRARVLANSTQKHRVSITDVSTKLMGDSDLWSQADGRVKFDFIETGIRIQNRTGAVWNTASGTIAVLLDMSDYLMAPLAATASPATIPLAAPQTGSAAIVQNGSGLWARDDFFGILRNGRTVMGAFLPAA